MTEATPAAPASPAVAATPANPAPAATPATPVAAAAAPDLPTLNPPPAPVELKLALPKESFGLDDKHVAGLTEQAKSLGLKPEQAQAWLDRDIASARARTEAAATMKADWLAQTKAANKAAEKPDDFHDLDVRVTQLVDKHADAAGKAEFMTWLKESGAIYYPPFFALMRNIANAGREGALKQPGIPTTTASPGKLAFPKSPINWTEAERAEWEAAGRPQL